MNVLVRWVGDAEPALVHATDEDGFGLYHDDGTPIYWYDNEGEWQREFPMPGHHVRYIYAEGTRINGILHGVVGIKESYQFGPNAPFEAVMTLDDWTTLVQKYPETACKFEPVGPTDRPIAKPTRPYGADASGKVAAGPPDAIGGKTFQR
jgi:hypothetical protein